MGKTKHPVTPAVRALRAAGVSFEPRPYAYVEHGGTQRSAEALGMDEHAVIKTLVLERDDGAPIVVLMHGDRRVSTKRVAKEIGAKSVRPCDPAVVTKHTGYVVGGTSPFGTRKSLPVIMQASIAALPRVVINGGKRGFLVELTPQDMIAALDPMLADVAVSPEE
ncbi:MAG: Cys-tRNA(Pro) deacylase [Nannocystaceae bacterium]|nr:Cys-tRNA(Pro) deacylase [bacterium]